MFKFLQKLLLLAALCVPWATQAQNLGDYTFSTGTDATLWVDMSGATQILTPTGNDALASSVQSIGFVFPFGNDVFTQFSVNTDGNLKLGGSPTGTSNYSTPFSSSNANVNSPKINAFGCDGYGVANSHYVKKMMVGDSMLVVEFCTGTFNSTTQSQLYKWQVHLHTNGNVEIVYPAADNLPTQSPNTTRQCGLCLNSGDGWTISATHVATHFTSGTSTTIATGTWPDANRYYRFVRPAVSCPSPYNLTAEATQTQATLSWTPYGTESEWVVTIGNTTVTVPDTFYVETGLSANTDYTFTVQAVCGYGDSSEVRTASFRTPCNFLDSIPYVYGFEDANTTTSTTATTTWAPCWTLLNNGSQYFGYPYISNNASYCHSGSHGTYWYGSTTTGTYGDYQCIVMPGVDLSQYSINQLMVKFWARATAASYHPVFKIGVMTNPRDINTFTEVATVNVEGTDWAEYEGYLAGYQGTGNYVAIKADRPTTSWYANVDDITLDFLPSCPYVTSLQIDTVSTDFATVSWTPSGDESSWLVYLDGDIVDVTSTNSYSLNNLTLNTIYEVGIRALCNNSDTSEIMSISVRTLAGAPINTFPYTCGFEVDVDNNINEGAEWVLENGSQANYWMIGTNTDNGGDRSLYITSDGTTNGYTVGSASYVFAYATFEFATGEYTYSYDWNAAGESSFDFIRAAIVPATVEFTAGDYCGFNNTSNVPAGGVAIDGANRLNLSTSWQTQVGTFNITTPGLYKMVFLWRNDGSGGSQPPAAIDNIQLSINTCPAPTNLTATNVTTDEVTVTWQAGGNETSWIVSIDGNDYPVTSTSYTFTGLNSNTPYLINVRAYCGDNDISIPVALSVRTACGEISQFPFIETFEGQPTNTSSVNTMIPCWHRLNNGTSYPGYPMLSATASYNHTPGGTQGFYWYNATTTGTYGDYQVIVLPPVDTTVQAINTLQLSFWTRATSTSYNVQFKVGVMTDPTDLTTFQQVAVVNVGGNTAWDEYITTFENFNGNGNYIAIRADRPTSLWYAALDDFTLGLLPDCPRVEDIYASSITPDGAEIHWTEVGSATSWNVSYVTHGGSIDTAETVTATDTLVVLTDLTPNTTYDVYIEVGCNDGQGGVNMFTFTTACDFLTQLPYVQNFETAATGSGTNNVFVDCWTRLNNGTTNFGYPYVGGSTYNHTSGGAKGLYWYNTTTTGTYGDYQVIVLPGVNTDDIALNTVQLSFWAKPSSTSYAPVFQIGTMTNPTDVNSFELYETVNVITGSTDWHKYEVMFDFYQGTANYIAIKAVRPTSSWYAYVDDIELSLIPSCRQSVNLAVDSLSYDAAVLTWRNSSDYVNSYKVYYSTQPGFNPDTCNTFETVYDTVATITGLQTYTTYYWTVVADCGNEQSVVPAIQSFTTLMDCGEGYVNILDTIGQGTTSGYTYFVYNYNTYPYGYTASIFTAAELGEMGLLAGANINSISVRAGSTACTINDLKIYMAETNIDGFTGASDTSLINALTLTQVYNGTLTTTAGQWIEIPLSTPFQYSGTNNLLVYLERTSAPSASGTFYYGSTSPDYHTLYGYRSSATATRTASRATYRVNMAFNLCAEVPDCSRPTDVVISSLEDTTVTINWVSNANSFEYVIGPSGFNPDGSTVTAITTADTFATIYPLNPNTEYDFYVRTICSGDVSDWSIVTSFRTACSAMQLPFTEDFESYGSGSTIQLNSCWVKGTSSTTAYPYPYSTNAVSGSRSLYFYGYQPSTASSTPIYSYAALPMMAAPIDTLQVSFSMRRYSTVTDYYTSRLLVGVMTDPSDISTFVGIDTIDLKDAPALSVHNFEVNLDSYTGTGKYIAFYDAVPPTYNGNNYSYSYVYLDDITVDYIPNCRRILDISFDGSNENSASFHWVDPNGNTGNGYEVEYGPEGFTPGTGTSLTTIDTFITITGLTASTGYDFYVRSICSASESGPWSFPTHFRTVCGIYPVPFFEDFENYGSGASYGIDPCWNKGTSSTTAYPYPYSTNAVSGERSLYFYGYQPSSASSTPIYSYVALPEFNVSVDSLELSFKVRRYSTTSDYYTTRLLVGVMTDPTDISTFVGIDTIDLKNAAGSSIHEVVVEFGNYTGTGKHIAIYDAVPPLYGTSTYSYSYAYVDDISVNVASPCGRPFNLDGNVTANSITLDWTDTVGATQWQIEYGPSGFEVGQGTTINVTQKPYTITGLTPSTSYDVYVRSFCSSTVLGGTNNGIYTYITSQIPATLPYLYTFENATEWANWQTASNNNVSWYRGTAEAAEGQYGLYVSADGGQTCNSLHSTITNAVVYRDIDFGATESSFEVSFLAKAAGINDGNYEGIHVMLVDPAAPVSSSSTALTSPWGTISTVHVVRDTNWGLKTLLFDNVSGVKRLVFYWFTSTTASHPVWEGAGAIDSIAVTEQSCVRPMNTSVTNVGSDFVSLTWDGPATDSYIVRLREVDGTVNNDTPVTGTSTTITGLQSMTHYYVWVYRQCGPDQYSYSAPRIEFNTTCTEINAVDTLREDFDSYTPVSYSAAGGVLPDCWEGYSNGTNANYMPHVTDAGTYSYSLSGYPITMTSGSATYGDTKIVRLPKFSEPLNTLTMSYWYCTESSSSGTLYVGYMTGFDYENDFVPIATHPASSASTHSGNGVQPAGTGVYDTVSFDTVPSNALFIAFKWYHNSSFYSVCIDNVVVTSSGNYCAAPTTLPATDITYNSATVNWSSNATDFEVAVKAATDATWPAEVAVSNATSYAVSGLTPATTYQYRVRAICDATEGMISEWAEGTFVTDSLPCFVPENFTVVETGYTTATLQWDAADNQTQWSIHVWNSANDYNYDANEHPFIVTGLAQNLTYYAAVKTICGNGATESEYSDTITFTTGQCAQVSGVNVTGITSRSAVVNWSSTGAPRYKVEYGDRGFPQGTGTTVFVENGQTSLTLENLAPDNNYSVFVMAICEEGVEGAWSERYDFATLDEDAIDVVNGNMNLSIYPNPTSDATTIALSGVNGEVQIVIVDMNGRTVMSDSMSCEGDCTKRMEVSGLAQGAYFVRVSGEGVNQVKKLVVK